MKKLDRIALELLCELEGLPISDESLLHIQQSEVKLELIKDTLEKYKKNEKKMDPELKQWYLDQFEIFWKKYGKRVGRTPAVKKWMGIAQDDVRAVLATVDEFVKVHAEVEYRPHPATYINQRRWEDELPSQRQRKSVVANRVKENTWELS